MTYEDFINREVSMWGEDYIFDLLDKGYSAVQLTDGMGNVKWSWRMPLSPLTNSPACATVGSGGGLGVSPVSLVSRL